MTDPGGRTAAATAGRCRYGRDMIKGVQTPGGTAPRRRRGRALAPMGVATAIVLAACGGSTAEQAAPATAAPAPVAAAAIPAEPTVPPPPPTTLPPTTTLSPTTTAAPTTVPPTTAAPITTEPPATIALEHAEQATDPVQPPADAWAEEPVVEMGTISIPKIDVSMTMYEGVRLTTLERGPGHWPGSALPGEAGNVVVGGHRVSSHAVFRHVDDLEAGDEIIFDDEDGRHVYRVRDVQIISPYDVWIVDPTETPTATLFACHPPGSTAQRIAVFADLVTG